MLLRIVQSIFVLPLLIAMAVGARAQADRVTGQQGVGRTLQFTGRLEF